MNFSVLYSQTFFDHISLVFHYFELIFFKKTGVYMEMVFDSTTERTRAASSVPPSSSIGHGSTSPSPPVASSSFFLILQNSSQYYWVPTSARQLAEPMRMALPAGMETLKLLSSPKSTSDSSFRLPFSSLMILAQPPPLPALMIGEKF